MKNFIQNLFQLALLFVLTFALVVATSAYYMRTAGNFTSETSVIIPKGTGSLQTVGALAEAGVLRFPYWFYAVQVAIGNTKKFKAGEYAFAAGSTPAQIQEKLVAGEVVVHKITLPEGWNVREAKALLLNDKILSGDITREMKEGSLLPETYQYTYGDTRDGMIARMQAGMIEALKDAWDNREEGLPIANKQEALILASIVEKETGVAGERPHVASVFINRLRKGMRLQTDPTVVYGIEQEKNAPMSRALTYADLEKPTPYNTYVIPALPPAPICNPGLDAIEAVLNPAKTDDLYFVATGHGGHNFSSTLDEHNRNVDAYRKAVNN